MESEQNNSKILASIILEKTLLPEDQSIYMRFTEAKIKQKNEIWHINKYDIDPFPSMPHNYEYGLKLDLSNGKMYCNKTYSYQLRKKALINFREKIPSHIKLLELSI